MNAMTPLSPPVYEQTTRDVAVRVRPTYLEHQSMPEQGRYVWAYTVQIENKGDDVIQLLSRYWRVTDSNGHVHEVRGDGVVGEQPVLSPGQSYEYTSGTPLGTPSGFMGGYYRMLHKSGEEFDVSVPVFSLDTMGVPHVTH